jgi:hypothetical protein
LAAGSISTGLPLSSLKCTRCSSVPPTQWAAVSTTSRATTTALHMPPLELSTITLERASAPVSVAPPTIAPAPLTVSERASAAAPSRFIQIMRVIMVPIALDGPAVEPVSVPEMRAYLRLDHEAEDELIAGLVKAGRLLVRRPPAAF